PVVTHAPGTHEVAMGGGGHLAASGCNRAAPLMDVANEALHHLRERLATFTSAARHAEQNP
ncbi:MAG TPA: hypothetical protein PKO06_14740, partial [Candidatus Ozemobacteraceae bacterium]|nr:hypothetical protein [Candidatus Ozemobacteraceae bacterium]